jgi:sarcosine oxidase
MPPPHQRSYDSIVVGLGAMGSAAAYHLARRGARVLGLDAFAPGHTRGSSHGETRILRLSYFEHPDYVPLLRRAYELWRQLERESGESLLRLTGGIYLGPPDGELVSGARRSAEQHGLAHELLPAAGVRRRFPMLAPTDAEGALYEPDAGMLFPERCIAAALRLAASHGAELRHESPVTAWRADATGVEVTTVAGTYRADQIVFTAGAWLGPLLGPLGGGALPLRVERNVVFWFPPSHDAALFDPNRFPVFIWETGAGHFYGLPHAGRPGVKVARHHTDRFGDPDSLDRTVRDADVDPVRRFLSVHIPALDTAPHEGLVCLYTLTPDGHFVIDRHPEYERVVFASACSGHGFKFASVVGEILADLTLTGRATPAADFLRLDRLVSRRG